MRKGLMIWAAVLTVFWVSAVSAGPPPVGSLFPDVDIAVPQKWEERQYLGVEGLDAFKITRVRAEVVVVEVFSMYCPFCQREAPTVNELQRLIASRPDIKGKIRLLGIGAGNSLFEVNAFKNLYGIRFPLIPDPDFALHDALGQVRTPCFIVVRNEPDGARVIYSKVGTFGEARDFLDFILQESKINQGA